MQSKRPAPSIKARTLGQEAARTSGQVKSHILGHPNRADEQLKRF